MFKSEKSILLVEDDTSTRLIIQKGISNWGFKILSVSSGKEISINANAGVIMFITLIASSPEETDNIL